MINQEMINRLTKERDAAISELAVARARIAELEKVQADFVETTGVAWPGFQQPPAEQMEEQAAADPDFTYANYCHYRDEFARLVTMCRDNSPHFREFKKLYPCPDSCIAEWVAQQIDAYLATAETQPDLLTDCVELAKRLWGPAAYVRFESDIGFYRAESSRMKYPAYAESTSLPELKAKLEAAIREQEGTK